MIFFLHRELFLQLTKHMKQHVFLFGLVVWSILSSWCTSSRTEPKVLVPSSQSLSREDRRVTIETYIDTPFTQDSPTERLWYGWVHTEDLLWTAKHLLDDTISRLVIKNNKGNICPIKQIWMHPLVDIALIQTSNICVAWARDIPFDVHKLPNEVVYIDGSLKKTRIITLSQIVSPLLEQQLAPGMSGSPLFLGSYAIVWIVSAQEEQWTAFVLLDDKLFTSRPEVKNVIYK